MEEKKYSGMAFRMKILSMQIFKLSRHDFEKRLKKEKISISPLAMIVLRMIKYDKCTIQLLSERLMIAPASLVPVIDMLEMKQYVKRSSDPKDRRRNPIIVTAKGEEVVAKMPAVANSDLLMKSLSRMGEKRSAQLISLLEELVTTLSGNKELCCHISEIANKETSSQRAAGN
jgi:DNA-binding MarR family transcriptional regulator